jgi:hypothetical protein
MSPPAATSAQGWHSRGVTEWLDGPYWLSSTGALVATSGCQIGYMDRYWLASTCVLVVTYGGCHIGHRTIAAVVNWCFDCKEQRGEECPTYQRVDDFLVEELVRPEQRPAPVRGAHLGVARVLRDGVRHSLGVAVRDVLPRLALHVVVVETRPVVGSNTDAVRTSGMS